MRIKYGTIKPFPDKPGPWIRLCFSNENLVQGMVMLFEGNSITMLFDGATTQVETVMEGDEKSRKEGITVTYTEIQGFIVSAFSKLAEKAQENGHGDAPKAKGKPPNTTGGSKAGQ